MGGEAKAPPLAAIGLRLCAFSVASVNRCVLDGTFAFGIIAQEKSDQNFQRGFFL